MKKLFESWRGFVNENEKCTFPKILYHATPRKNLPSIQKKGLTPRIKSDTPAVGKVRKDRIFLSKFNDIYYMSLPADKLEDDLVILEIDTEQLDKNKMFPDDGLYWAFWNEQLTIEQEMNIFPDIAKRFRHIHGQNFDEEEWEEFILENEPSIDELDALWQGKWQYTLCGEFLDLSNFELGEIGYQDVIPPEAITIYRNSKNNPQL